MYVGMFEIFWALTPYRYRKEAKVSEPIQLRSSAKSFQAE
jgi:hypothetical protein